jgi:hypothetical protein
MRALLAVGDKMFEARLSSETAISSFTIMDGRDGSTLVLDGSDRGEGVSAFPLSLHAQTVMTHWPGAEIYGESAKGFEAWPICDHRRLSIALERGSSSDVTCRRYDHDAWHEFTFERGGEHQSVLFVHGGPTLRFALDQRPYLLQLPLFGYRLRAVNYTDQDPPPEGEDGVRQADQAERQIVESWLSERRTSNTEPVVLVESFGFQLLGRLLARDEPLTIWAVSPIVSSQGWLALEKRRGAAEGIPWANWPRSESIVTSRRSPMAALCRRKSPTRLVIVAAARDPVIDPITASDLAKLKSCSHVDVEFISEDGDDHASGRLFADLFQREMDPNAGLPTLSLGAEM